MKRMQHPLHGFHHAYTPAEEARMVENGWKEEIDVPETPKIQDEQKREVIKLKKAK